MHMVCRQCSTRLTADLELVSLDTQNQTMGEDLLARGSAMQEDGSSSESEAGKFLGNIADAAHMTLTSDMRRLNGCCGLDGCDGPNLLCEICDTYVATKRTDCWTPHYVVFDPNTTKAVMESAQ